MINDAAAVSLILKALGYGVPAAVLTGCFLVFMLLLKYQKQKSERDRSEHMKKWDSMITTQKEVTDALIQSHRQEIDRAFKMQERQADALDIMGRNLTLISERLEQTVICPMERK